LVYQEGVHIEAHAHEAELVRRAQHGEVDAFEQLVERYSDLAFRTAYLILRSAAEAEDACQEAFYKAYRALPRFRTELPLRPWLLRIVVNEARNRRRGIARRGELELAPSLEAPAGAAPSPESSAVRRDRDERLLAVVEALSDEDREVVTCRFFLDLSVEETAAVLGRPSGTVKSRLSRALARVRQTVGDDDD
jgi:RNA polymerase sigma factor (sigma-70 family)